MHVTPSRSRARACAWLVVTGLALAVGAPSARVARATLAEAVGMVVFTRLAENQQDVFIADARGDGEVQVTDSEDVEWDPRWSPDGREIAFHTVVDERVTIWRAPYAGGTSTPVAEDVGGDYWSGYPSWHPDGDCVTYAGAHPSGDGRTDLFMRCGGDPARRLVATDDRNESGSSWAPDGSRVAYEVYPADLARHNTAWGIRTARADGSDDRVLVDEAFRSERQPRWSPDGRYVAYMVYALEGGYGSAALWVLDVPTGQSSELVRAVTGPPAWSPDSRQVLVTAIVNSGIQPVADLTLVDAGGPGDPKGLYLVDLVGRTIERLHGHPGGRTGRPGQYEWGYGPDWSPGTPTATPLPTDRPTATGTATATATVTLTPTPDSIGRVLWLPHVAPGAAVAVPVMGGG